MGEYAILVLAVTQMITVGAILTYLFLKERRQENFFLDISTDTRVTTEQERIAYLRHINQLEKMLVEKGRPKLEIDEDDVRRIMERGPEKTDNEIAHETDDGSIEINESNFKNIPFGLNTNVLIEGDMPTTIEE